MPPSLAAAEQSGQLCRSVGPSPAPSLPLAGVALLAFLVPSRSAGKADPVATLRAGHATLPRPGAAGAQDRSHCVQAVPEVRTASSIVTPAAMNASPSNDGES